MRRSEEGSLGRLRVAALIAVLLGAVGSLLLLLHAGQRTPRFLLVIFVFWVLSPFLVLVWADRASKRWSALTRAALYRVTLVVALGSLAIYGDDALGHRTAKAAFVYVAVPPVSWLLTAIVIPIAAWNSRRRSRRGDGA